MAARSDDTDLAIVFAGLCIGAVAAFSLGTSVAVGTIAGGALAQAVVVLRRRGGRSRVA
jgi:hypothetical protein